MIGIVPSSSKTFEVYGSFTSTELVEGKLYYEEPSKRLYFYSKVETRSNPRTGYFPVWDGVNKYVTNFSNSKYLDKDAILTDINSMSASINKDVATKVLYNQRRSIDDALLQPEIADGDNMFTQCIKGTINAKQLTMTDLIDMSCPPLTEKIVENSYASLTKIAFMRMDKWSIWIDTILHVQYVVRVYRGEKLLITYRHPEETFDTGIVKYDSIINTNDDSLKKVIKILMVMENIDKASLRSPEVDDYTINNMMTTLSGTKPLSAQLFSRFMRMARLIYTVDIMDAGTLVFQYKEVN